MKIASYLNVNGFNIKPLNYRKLLPDLKIIRFERQISIAAYFNVNGIKIAVVTYRIPGYYIAPLDDRTIKLLTELRKELHDFQTRFLFTKTL